MRAPVELLLIGLCAGFAEAAGCGGNVIVDSGGGGQSSSDVATGVGGGNGGGVTTSSTGTIDTTSTTTSGVGGASADCASYCSAIMANCQGENYQYLDETSCLAVCPAFAPGNPADTEGNTLACRAYHAGPPSENDPKVHCIHAGPYGAQVCGSPCESFCAVAAHACTGPNDPFSDNADCSTACASIADGVPYDTTVTSGDSLACRLYHAVIASYDPGLAAFHCPHVGVASATCQ